MTISKVPWRKPPIPKQVAVICTRLILPDAVPTVKKYGFQRGSERTICLCKDLSRTAKGGAGPVLLPVPIHVPPGQSDSSCLLTKFNGDCDSNTHSGSHHSSNRKHPLSSKRKWVQFIHHQNRHQKSNRSIHRNQEILPVSY